MSPIEPKHSSFWLLFNRYAIDGDFFNFSAEVFILLIKTLSGVANENATKPLIIGKEHAKSIKEKEREKEENNQGLWGREVDATMPLSRDGVLITMYKRTSGTSFSRFQGNRGELSPPRPPP